MIIWRNLRTAHLARLMETFALAVQRPPPGGPANRPVPRGRPSRRGNPPGKRPLVSGGDAGN